MEAKEIIEQIDYFLTSDEPEEVILLELAGYELYKTYDIEGNVGKMIELQRNLHSAQFRCIIARFNSKGDVTKRILKAILTDYNRVSRATRAKIKQDKYTLKEAIFYHLG